MRNHPDLVRFFRAEPDLLLHVPEGDRGSARDRLIVESLSLCRDAPLPSSVTIDKRSLGLLVLDGLFVRRTNTFGRLSMELLGPGDVFRPQAERPDVERVTTSWRTVAPSEVAVLDRRFVAESGRWDGVITELLDRVARRTTTLSVQLAVAQLPRLESRLMCILWYLGQRWGSVGPNGLTLRLPVTHDLLAGLTTARRSSVSAAVARLRDQGLLEQPAPGTWQLNRSSATQAEFDALLADSGGWSAVPA